MNDDEKAKKIIEENLYMTVSVSSKDGDPWIANLYYAYDKNYNFYWYSPINSQHSQVIKENPSIAIAIFNSSAVGDDIDAVYIKAEAQEVSGRIGIVKGLAVYGKKMLKTGVVTSRSSVSTFMKRYKDFQGDSQIRLYKATPSRIWKLAPSEIFNDKYIDSRVEVDIVE